MVVCRLPRDAKRPGARARRLAIHVAAATLLLRPPCADAAAYLPGAEADAPTGASGRTEAPAEPAGNGIRWEFAPPQTAGTVSLDARTLRLADGSRTTQAVVFNDIEAATYVWQPWFVQMRAGLGVLAAQDSARGPDAPAERSHSSALTGRFNLSVFPASRFPFELAAEVGDSRVRGDTLGTDYRSRRLVVTQAWRPEAGNDSYSLALEHSRLSTVDGMASSATGTDTVTSLRGSALREFAAHSFELSGQLTRNERAETDERSRLSTLNARHTFHPASALHVDTLASWNDVELRSGSAASRFDSSTDLRQLSSFATWRPGEGDWFYSPTSPLYLTGSARLIDARSDAASDVGTASQRVRALNESLGVSQDLTRAWRLAGSVSGTQLQPAGGQRSQSANASAAATYSPEGRQLGAWRYTPTLALTAGAARSTDAGSRSTYGGQFAHGVSRSVTLGGNDSLSYNLTQSAGALHDSQTAVWSRALAHSFGMFWQGAGAGDLASQSYAGLSASDSRTREVASGSFQLVNLQLSRRTQVTRHASWSGNLTWQASRSDSSQLDVFTGEQRRTQGGWQRFYSGSLNWENDRFLDVPRLRYSALLAVNSQQLDSRAAGDIDAPRERVTASLENRLDYTIGRLEARLSARVARVDGRSVGSVFARLQRRY